MSRKSTKTRQKSRFDYLIGFDADTKRCGLVVADVQNGKIVETHCKSLMELTTVWLPDFLQKYKGKRYAARIEMPTLQTAMSVNKYVTSRFDYSQNLHNSGRCSEVAKQFKQLCEIAGIVTETVPSSCRVRCDSSNIKRFDTAKLQQLAMNKFNGTKRSYLSKVDTMRGMRLFPNLGILNDETIDAALLVLPEIILAKEYNKFYNIVDSTGIIPVEFAF